MPISSLIAVAADRALARCYDTLHRPLDNERKLRVINYLLNPREPIWNDISGLCIGGFTTLWQAVIQVDPTFPRAGRRYDGEMFRVIKKWERIPEPELVLKAIKHITEEKTNEFTNNNT